MPAKDADNVLSEDPNATDDASEIVSAKRGRHPLSRIVFAGGWIAIFTALGVCGAQLREADALNGWKQKVSDTRPIVLHLSDGGRRWTDVSPGALSQEVKRRIARDEDVLESISALSPLDDKRAWLAISTGATVLMEYSSDSGLHWKETAAPIKSDTIAVSFLDETRGFLLSASAPAAGLMRKEVYHTDDAGRHWSLLAAPDAGSYYVTGIAFRSPSDGWITGTYHGGDAAPLYRTKDGGKTWQLQKLEIPADFRRGYADTYPPVFSGKDKARGRMRVKLVRHEPPPDRESWVDYLTEDGGRTWRPPGSGAQTGRK